MELKKPSYSSHAIVVDDEWILYFELNKKLWGKISLFWWWLDLWETHINAIIRELEEEIFITAKEKDFVYIEKSWPKKFPKWIIISEIYALLISTWVWKIISNSDTVIKLKYDDLKLKSASDFVIEKEEFLWRIEKSLSLLKIKIWI